VDLDTTLRAVPNETRQARDVLRLLADVMRSAGSSQGFASLPLQAANAVKDLAANLWVRGESHLEHYYAEAIALACVRPSSADMRRYEALLLTFIRFDRRHPALPDVDAFLPLNLQDQQSIHFVQLARSQPSFQALYEAARQFDAYGAMGRSARKVERIVLFARELSGRPLLADASAEEGMYMRLAS
jgi:hypothetical protein